MVQWRIPVIRRPQPLRTLSRGAVAVLVEESPSHYLSHRQLSTSAFCPTNLSGCSVVVSIRVRVRELIKFSPQRRPGVASKVIENTAAYL